MQSAVPAGWYRDPDGNECERYWDGNNWSLKTRPLITSVSQTPQNNNEISAGWWIAIAICGIFAIAILLILSEDSSNYYSLQFASYQALSDSDHIPYESTFSKSSHLA